MQTNPQEYIDILISLEPVFKKAGVLAAKMRQTAKSKNKFNTGVAGIDIVTEADLAVQEFILSEIVKTKLIGCEIFAEEQTELVKKFKGTNGLVLTLDPIDGTLIYSSEGKFYCTIVSLHGKKDILYTFLYYPVFDWSRRITGGIIKDSGEFPKIKVKENLNLDLDKVIYCHNTTDVDPGIYRELAGKGYKFCGRTEITEERGSYILIFSDTVAGCYFKNPNPYDGLVALHYAKAKQFKIYGNLDITEAEPSDHGPHYQGWYLILKSQ